MMKLQFVLLAFIAVTIIRGIVEASQECDMWTKISRSQVCFEGKGNRPGVLKYTGENAMVFAMKLSHRSGRIRCAANRVHDSLWGCTHLHGLERYPLNVVVTDIANHVIYPKPKFLYPNNHGLKSAMWYYLPGTDSYHSKELVFTDYKTPFYLRKGSTLRIWYGEDLTNKWETDNGGRVCVDVFALMTTFY